MDMKCIGLNLFMLLSLVIFQGCMPDSLTKFKEDSKPASVPESSGGSTPETAPSDLVYSQETYTFTVGNPIVALTPTATGVVESYSISPSLPLGLQFNTSSGRISGSPLVSTSPTNYIVTASNSIGSVATTINIAAYNQPSALKFNLTPRLIITMSNPSTLSVGGQFTTISGQGTVKQISGNVVDVEISSGHVISGQAVIEAGGNTISEISYKNSIQIFPVNLGSIGSFSIGSYISSPASQGSSLGIVTQILPDSIVVSMIRGTFAPDETLDNTTTYASTDLTVENINFLLNNGDSIDLRPSVSGELVTYELVTDALPAGFNAFSSSLGYVIGTYQTTQTTSVGVKAINAVGSVSTTFSMGPLVASPQYLSMTQNAVIKIADTSLFSYGQIISTPSADEARVLQVLDSEYLYIRILKGTFDKNKSIDNTAFYGGEKGNIIDIAHVSEVLQVPNGTGASFTKGGYISSSDGGRGIISHIHTASNPDLLFVRTSIPGFISDPALPSNLDDTSTYIVTLTSLVGIRSNNLAIVLDDETGFVAGSHITQENSGNHATGIVRDINAAANIVYVKVDHENFVVNNLSDDVDNQNPLNGPIARIVQMRNDPTFYLETGREARITATLLSGNNITYNISPDLPEGLVLNAQNGSITGTPVASSIKKAYTLTASNNLGGVVQSTSYSFNIKIDSIFSLTNITETASSYVLHKVGKGNEIADCTVTEAQINSSDITQKDITCMLEGQELDLYKEGFTTKSFSSKGLCKYISVRPYGFWRWAYSPTTSENIKYVIAGSCTGGPRAGFPDANVNRDGSDFRCNSDYSSDELNGPNCDPGTYTTVTITFTDLDNDGTCDGSTLDTTESSCGGTRMACFSGPSADTYDVAQLTAGIRSTVTNTLNGGDIDFTANAPIQNGYGTNRSIANYTANNSCADGDGYNYNTTNWRAYAQNGAIQTRSGTVDANQYENTLTGTGTAFTSQFSPGDSIYISGQVHKIASIQNDTNLTLQSRVLNDIVGATIQTYPYSDPFRYGSEPFYQYECLDAAYDTIARIRLLVRDWDKDFKITDDIDRLTIPLNGTIDTTAGSSALTGIGTAFETELGIGDEGARMIKTYREINTVTTVASDTAATMYLNAGSTAAGITAIVRPLKSDAGEALNDFLNPWNSRPDWDDYLNSLDTAHRYPALESCSSGTPITNGRLSDYTFPADEL